ncbi:Clathrin coat assembly protein [Thalictrum thalictroides]|uniref:Clathrin coat assembly protein n=1 Tax=Thalictrum thalictroides TaxID=46969 RepID=A0A7J6X9P5_THATH|nr:Clathrin coat assembly protein [Thalictrum thalictroides]
MIGKLKDSTSIGLSPSKLEVAILKATTHEEFPVEDRHINEILLFTSSNKVYAKSCAELLAKRIGRTNNWIVALKALMIVLRVFQDGDPHFPKEVLITMKRGKKILNLSNFRDDYNSSPWDYTAFVRTFALYLNDRLECFLTGKLQRRMVIMKERDQLFHQYQYQPHNKQRYNEHVRDMKPAVLLDRITHWQQLLVRAIGTRPTGAAKTNRLVQISLYAIVRETFDLYRDISDGLSLLLDSFFNLQYQCCKDAYQACIKSSQQFEELSKFYTVCKDIGVGRSSEYPSVQKISEELIDTLHEFLKDKSSFPIARPQMSSQLLLPAPSLPNDSMSKNGQGGRYRAVSLEDLINVPEPGSTSPSYSTDTEHKSMHLESTHSIEDFLSMDTAETNPGLSTENQERNLECSGKPSLIDDLISVYTAETSLTLSTDDQDRNLELSGKPSSLEDLFSVYTARTSPAMSTAPSNSTSGIDLGLLDDPIQTQLQNNDEANQTMVLGHDSGSRDEWELVLAETASNISLTQKPIDTTPSACLNFMYNDQAVTSHDQSNHNNPFLVLGNELAIIPSPTDSSSIMPTFQAAPTFCVQNPNETRDSDPFNLPMHTAQPTSQNLSQPHLIWEQQLWLQNQNGIIAKHVS